MGWWARVAAASVLATGAISTSAEAGTIQTCLALNSDALKSGHPVYMVSSEFTIYDPSSRDAAAKEWTQYAASRGFEPMGCDANTYKAEVAAIPRDTKIVNSNWKPSQGAVLAGANAIKSGKRNFRNASACIQNVQQAVENKCDYPVKIGFCFAEQNAGSGDTFDKTCQRQKFGLTAVLAPNQQTTIGTYRYVYYFACENPAEPQNMYFDGSSITGVCSAP
jgi:hypothetical protein